MQNPTKENCEHSESYFDRCWMGRFHFLETSDQKGKKHYALIDSNDSPTLRSSYIFVQRFFEKEYAKQNLKLPDPKTQPLFDWVLLTHAHGDHAEGLKRLMQGFGAARFWYPIRNSSNPPKPVLSRKGRSISRRCSDS